MDSIEKNRLTREALFELIARNGGPKGLDLSFCDLSGLELGDEFTRKFDHQFPNIAEYAYLTIDSNQRIVINLQEANLYRANLRGTSLRFACLQRAYLAGADLSEADLNGANLRGVYLRRGRLNGAYLRHTNLDCAYLGAADFEGARMLSASLFCADLHEANLTNADLTNANLEKANLDSAVISNTRIKRSSLGLNLLQESSRNLLQVLNQPVEWEPWLKEKTSAKLRNRLVIGSAIYRSLKNNFLDLGEYEDAVWAYARERKLLRDTHGLKSARVYYRRELLGNDEWHLPRVWLFYFRHGGMWILDWLAEVSSGYGHEPLRTVFWLFLTPLVFAMLFWVLYALGLGGVLRDDTASNYPVDYLIYSMGAMVTMQFGHLDAATGLTQFFAVLEAFTGISLAALLMFTLGNRISRV